MWAEQVEDSSIVTTMARNGTTFGVRLAGSSTWFLAEAPEIGDALYNPGFGPGSGARDIGDSAVLELVGLGGAAAAGSPAVAAFLGGTMADAAEVTENMTDICHGDEQPVQAADARLARDPGRCRRPPGRETRPAPRR